MQGCNFSSKMQVHIHKDTQAQAVTHTNMLIEFIFLYWHTKEVKRIKTLHFNNTDFAGQNATSVPILVLTQNSPIATDVMNIKSNSAATEHKKNKEVITLQQQTCNFLGCFGACWK